MGVLNMMVNEGVPLSSVAPLMDIARKSEGGAEEQAVKNNHICKWWNRGYCHGWPVGGGVLLTPYMTTL